MGRFSHFKLIFLLYCPFVFSESFPSQNQYILQLRMESAQNQIQAKQVAKVQGEQIVRSKLNEWVTENLRKPFTFQNLTAKSIEKTLDTLNDITLFSENSENLSPPTPSTSSTSQAIPKQSGRLLLGWNLRESSSKLEYRENHFNVGVYHSRTLSAITGQESFTEALAFQLNTQWDDEKMRASIQLPWNFPYYSFSVTKEFSADFSSSLTTQAAAQGSRLARKLELKVVLTF